MLGLEVIRTFVKSYFVFLLILQILSYLTPKDSYKKYVQFFTGALMAVILIRPVLEWMNGGTSLPEYTQFEEVMQQMEEICYEGEGEDMFEIFFMEDTAE